MTKGDDQVWFSHSLGKRPEAAKGGSMKIEPVASIVPCYTPSGKRVALNTRHQGLPIGTVLYTEAQMRQLGEACAAVAEREHSTDAERVYGKEVAELIRNLIKEMLP